jgi:hypothetical protein
MSLALGGGGSWFTGGRRIFYLKRNSEENFFALSLCNFLPNLDESKQGVFLRKAANTDRRVARRRTGAERHAPRCL